MKRAGLRKLYDLFQEAENDKVKIKCLYALACLIRSNNEATKIFVKDFKGVAFVLKQLETVQNPQVKVKLLFLFRYLTQKIPAILAASHQAALPVIINFVNSESVDLRENSITILEQFATDYHARQRITESTIGDVILPTLQECVNNQEYKETTMDLAMRCMEHFKKEPKAPEKPLMLKM